MKNFLNQLILK